MINETFRKALADSKVPGHLHEGLVRWVEAGIAPGSFLSAVIRNDLLAAVARADSICEAHLGDICSFLCSEAVPYGAFFADDALRNWPTYIQAENRVEAAEQARIALEETVDAMEVGS